MQRRLAIFFVGVGLLLGGCKPKRPIDTEPADDVAAAPREPNGRPVVALEATEANGVIGRLGGQAFRFGERHSFLGFSTDGTRCFTSSWNANRLCTWDTGTGKQVANQELPAGATIVCAISADDRLVATYGENVGLRVKTVDGEKTIQHFPDYHQRFRPHRVTFAPKNDVLAVADEYGGLRIYDLATGKTLPSPLPDGKYNGTPLADVWISGLHFVAEGRKLVISKPNKSPLVWDVKEGNALRPFSSRTLGVVLEWPLGKECFTLASDRDVTFSGAESTPTSRSNWSFGSRHATLRVSNLEDGREIRSFGVSQEVRAAALSGDGKLLATLGADYSDVNRRLVVWNVDTGKQLAQWSQVEEGWDVAFAPDHRTLVTIGNRSLRFWQVPSGEGPAPRRLVELHPGGEATEGVSDLGFAPDGKQLFVASAAGLAIWSLPERKLTQQVGEHESYGGNVFALDPRGNYFVLARQRGSQRWDRQDQLWAKRSGTESFLKIEWVCRRLAVSPDGKLVVSGSRKTEGFTIVGEFPATFQLWRSADGEAVEVNKTTKELLSRQDLVALCFSPSGQSLAIAHGYRPQVAHKVAILDAANGFQKLRGFTFPRGAVLSLAYTPDGEFLAVGGGREEHFDKDKFIKPTDHGVLLYPSQGVRPVRAFEGHVAPVLAVAISPDGRWLATGSEDKTCRLWNLTNRTPVSILGGHEGPVTAVAFSPNGETLATGSEDTTVLLWDVVKLVQGSQR